MEAVNPLNVFKGPDAIVKYYDPDQAPPVPLVEIPDKLNPFRKDGVRIYAKLMGCLPAKNVKSLAAKNMLKKSVTPETTEIIEYSSGSTILSLAVIARAVHNIESVHAYVSNKTSRAKLRMLQFFGLKVTLFGGPSQPLPGDQRGGIFKATQIGAENPEVLNPNQYENQANPEAHFLWTGPQILKQLPEINVFAASMGTSGTMAGTAQYLKKAKPSVHTLAICTAAGDRVPGPRTRALLEQAFPWMDVVDSMEDVTSPPAFLQSLRLTQEGIICGPSSGINLQGLLNFIEKRKEQGTLKELAAEDGEIHCVFLCCDLPYQYIDEYFDKLGEESFYPITNQNLHDVDLYRYDVSWELEPADAFARLYEPADASYDSPGSDSELSDLSEPTLYNERNLQLQPNTMVLDLRSALDFEQWHLPCSINLPLSSAVSDGPSVFDDAKLLEVQWVELEKIFSPKGTPFSATLLGALRDRFVVLMCEDGDTARVGASVLRAKGIEASSIVGGIRKSKPFFRRKC